MSVLLLSVYTKSVSFHHLHWWKRQVVPPIYLPVWIQKSGALRDYRKKVVGDTVQRVGFCSQADSETWNNKGKGFICQNGARLVAFSEWRMAIVWQSFLIPLSHCRGLIFICQLDWIGII